MMRDEAIHYIHILKCIFRKSKKKNIQRLIQVFQIYLCIEERTESFWEKEKSEKKKHTQNDKKKNSDSWIIVKCPLNTYHFNWMCNGYLYPFIPRVSNQTQHKRIHNLCKRNKNETQNISNPSG